MMKRFLNYVGSRRFAIYLLVVTTAVILFANLLPNLSLMNKAEQQRFITDSPTLYWLSSRLGVTSITRSPYFQLVPFFIFLSVTICTLKRVKIWLDRRERRDDIPDRLTIRHSFEIKDSGEGKEWCLSLLKRKRWHTSNIQRNDEDIIVGVKGRSGIWGSVAFHLGLNITLAGILVSSLTGVSGAIFLTEGFPSAMPAEINGIKPGDADDFPLSGLLLEKFSPVFNEEGFPVDYRSELVARKRGGDIGRYLLRVNDPIDIEGYSLIYGEASFAPRFILRDEEGVIIDDLVAPLLISMPGISDEINLPDEGLRIKVEIFPDYYEENGEHGSRGLEPRNPVLFVEIERWDKVIGRGFLSLGKAEKFDKFSLEFKELNYWLKIMVSRDIGIPIILAGFLFIAIGLLIRFVLIDKRLWIIIKKTSGKREVSLGGRADYFPALFEDELRTIFDEIRKNSKE